MPATRDDQVGNAVIPVSIPVSVLVRLQAYAAAHGESRSAVVASAVEAMLNRAGA